MRYKTIVAVLLYCLSAIMLNSCAQYQHYHERMLSKKACFTSCQQRFRQCSLVCDDDAKQCSETADAVAAVHFNQYRHQRCVKGALVDVELNSFRDPLACLKTSCDCKKDIDVCIQSCQGIIHKHIQAVT